MIVSIIVAIGKEGQIGLDGKIPWHIADDLKRFKKITQGHTVVMGRKTYDSVGRPFPKRNNIIISSNENYKIDGCNTFTNLLDAIEYSREHGENELFLIGGSRIYSEGITLADKLYLTRVFYDGDADTYFPDIENIEKKLIEKEEFADRIDETYMLTR